MCVYNKSWIFPISNVLEKCLIYSSQAEIAGIIEELCEQDRYVLYVYLLS